MKVVAILGGLGSQMIKYAFYLSVKKNSINEECYIDTFLFDKMKMWNGYELDKVFNIKEQDIKNIFSQEEIKEIIKSPESSSKYIIDKMLKLDNKKAVYYNRGIKIKFTNNELIIIINKIKRRLFRNLKLNKELNLDVYPLDYLSSKYSAYYDEFDHKSDLYFKDIKEELYKVFKFKELEDLKNIQNQSLINNSNSVSIHVRRSDHLYDNNLLYTGGYFKRATNIINEKVLNPVYFIFSEDATWCRENINELGLDSNNDTIYFIDWNTGVNSYIDMQLMSYCKHNIIPNSSFSWWAAYLNKNKEKITIAPIGYWLDISYHL